MVRELEILKKKVSSYRNEGGQVRKVSDELLLEILGSWEQWTGPAVGFYTGLGISPKGIASIIKKAKRLRREGFPSGDFKEIKIDSPGTMGGAVPCIGIELGLPDGKVIRFPLVDQLVEFLKKAA